jgi:hypothetical protein
MSKKKKVASGLIKFETYYHDTFEFNSFKEIFWSGRGNINQLIGILEERLLHMLNPSIAELEKMLSTLKGNFPKLVKKCAGEEGSNRCERCSWKDINNKCEIKKEAGMQEESSDSDSACFFKHLSAKKLEEVISKLEKERKDLVREKRLSLQRKKKLLFLLRKGPGRKPLLPELREIGWFKKGEKVVVLNLDRNLYNVMIAVVEGTRDPYVFFYSGRTGRCDPRIMNFWEFKFLLKNPDFADWYARKSELNEKEIGIFKGILKDGGRYV